MKNKKQILVLILFWAMLLVPCLAFAANVSQNSQATDSKEETYTIKENAPLDDADKKTIGNITDEEIGKYLLSEGVSPEELKGKSDNREEENLPSAKYTLGPDDVIEITVLRHPEVSGEYIINNEGNIQYEFVGDIKIEGMTKEEATKVIKEKLSTYIISPDITVKILAYNSKIVYVIGEVSHPGKIFMRGDTITVREALIRAGLPMLSAKASKSKLITPSKDKKPIVRRVNVDKLLYEGDLRENLVMKPGDTLFVPPTLMTKAMRVLQPISAPISTAAGTGRTVTTGF